MSDLWEDVDEAERREAPDVTDPVTRRPRRLSEMCATCIMRAPADGQIQLAAERLREFINEVRAADSYVVCHSTLPGMSDAEPAICRGYADRYSSNYLRIMERLGGFVDVEPPVLRTYGGTDG
jgi:hypothetical protein